MKKDIKNLINLIIYKCGRVHKHLIVFSSFNGHYSDSPKYLMEAIHRLDKTVEIIWLVNPKYAENVPKYAKCVDIDSKLAIRARSHARVLIDNIYCDREFTVKDDSLFNKIKKVMFLFFNNKKRQIAITTWHGTPLKCIGRDQAGNKALDFICPGVTMVLGNQFSSDILRHVTFGKIPIKLLGSPRNDLLFYHEDVKELKKKIGLPLEKKVILFAPTFREDGKETFNKNVYRSGLQQLQEMEFEKLLFVLHQRFGGEWTLVCRFHYHVEKMVDWNLLEKKYNRQIINGNINDDMAEYLTCADILLTDSSSCMFDFMLTMRPCFLYFPDYENYKNKERGLYLPIESLPFPMAQTFQKLLLKIQGYDDYLYKRNVKILIQKMGYVDGRNSSLKIARYILKRMKSKENNPKDLS